jgi:hypothetical protein
MGENEEMTKVPRSILEEIMEKTFQKLDDKEDFDNELIFELRKLALEGSFLDEERLISILKGVSP